LKSATLLAPVELPALSPVNSPGPDPADKGKAAKIIEAVIAEFRSSPPEGKKTAPVSSADEETPDAPEASDAPANGDDAPDSPKPAARRVNFVRRWFVSRTRGS